MNANDKFIMLGTEGTGEYIVTVVTPRGRVGFRRDKGRNVIRVRLEPASTEVTEKMRPMFEQGWKTPGQGGQDRFSTVFAINDAARLRAVLRVTHSALGTEKIEVNPALAGLAQELALRGANLATAWPVETLAAKLAQAFTEKEAKPAA